MPYQRLFNLQIFHEYYRDKVCSDFTIQPTQACRQLMRGHRLILKNTVNGLWLLIPIGADQKPVIPFSDQLTFTFLLKVNNPAFLSFTQLDATYAAIASLYTFSNRDCTTPGTIDLSPVLVQFDHNPSPLKSHLAQIAELHTSERKTVFGIVEIQNNGSLSTNSTQVSEFRITFSAKSQIWKYYLVVDRNTQPTTFSIQDKDAEIMFSQAELHAGDRVAATIQHRFPHSQSYLFQSEEQVSCRELGRQNIQLLKNGQTKPWISHLPTPPNLHGTQVINMLEDV